MLRPEDDQVGHHADRWTNRTKHRRRATNHGDDSGLEGKSGEPEGIQASLLYLLYLIYGALHQSTIEQPEQLEQQEQARTI